MAKRPTTTGAPLTRDHHEEVRRRARRDVKFRQELLREAIDCLITGDLMTAKILLGDVINATKGYEHLSQQTQIPSKSLLRMMGPRGNPLARHLITIIGQLQQDEGVRAETRLRRVS